MCVCLCERERGREWKKTHLCLRRKSLKLLTLLDLTISLADLDLSSAFKLSLSLTDISVLCVLVWGVVCGVFVVSSRATISCSIISAIQVLIIVLLLLLLPLLLLLLLLLPLLVPFRPLPLPWMEDFYTACEK